MKILHLSFHYGCISDINYVMKKLGHEIDYEYLNRKIPYHINESLAHSLWNQNKEKFNTYDVIITTDTVAISYIFLLHLAELKPSLIILNCNRFTYAMEHEVKFIQLLRDIQSCAKYTHKVTYIPYTDFERIWCARHGLYLSERSIQPIGKYPQHINNKDIIIDCFKDLNKAYMTEDIKDTMFIQTYHNHVRFMDLCKYLHQHQISNIFGGYANITELKPYKALVVLPDAFSKYFVYESIQEELVILVPSPKFLLNLVQQGGYFFNIEGSGGRLTQEYVNLCEWYKYPETRIYFDSFEEMVSIIKNLKSDKIESIKKWCRFYANVIDEEHMNQWKNIFNKIMLHQQLSIDNNK